MDVGLQKKRYYNGTGITDYYSSSFQPDQQELQMHHK